jgi:Pectate lyase superfamily protein
LGALGNGTQDDYGAISKAINSAQAPVKIYFPQGNYLISHPLVTTHDGTVFLFDNAKLSIPTATSGGKAIYMIGEDPDQKSNYIGNNLKNVSIHENVIIGNSNPGNIRLDKATPGADNVVHNTFQ